MHQAASVNRSQVFGNCGGVKRVNRSNLSPTGRSVRRGNRSVVNKGLVGEENFKHRTRDWMKSKLKALNEACGKKDFSKSFTLDLKDIDGAGKNLFMLACRSGDTDLVEAMLFGIRARKPEEFKEILNRQDKSGRTAIYFATQGRHISVIDDLIEAGADASIENVNKISARTLLTNIVNSDDRVSKKARKLLARMYETY